MTKLVSLDTRPKQINKETVEILEAYLVKAKSGVIEGVAIAAILPDGSSDTQSSSTDHFQRLIGAVAILQHRMIDECRGVA
jgi:hypothetical protein